MKDTVGLLASVGDYDELSGELTPEQQAKAMYSMFVAKEDTAEIASILKLPIHHVEEQRERFDKGELDAEFATIHLTVDEVCFIVFALIFMGIMGGLYWTQIVEFVTGF